MATEQNIGKGMDKDPETFCYDVTGKAADFREVGIKCTVQKLFSLIVHD